MRKCFDEGSITSAS